MLSESIYYRIRACVRVCGGGLKEVGPCSGLDAVGRKQRTVILALQAGGVS